jgi:hypothetical protein
MNNRKSKKKRKLIRHKKQNVKNKLVIIKAGKEKGHPRTKKNSTKVAPTE